MLNSEEDFIIFWTDKACRINYLQIDLGHQDKRPFHFSLD